MVWETIWLLVILKIPIIYLAWVIWWAVKAEPAPPEPLEGALVTEPLDPDPRAGWRFLRRRVRPARPRPGPHGTPRRSARRVRAPLPSSWQAAGWRDDA